MDFIEWLIREVNDDVRISPRYRDNLFKMIRRYCITELNVWLGESGMQNGNVELKRWIYPDIYADYG
jgi:hypothetical protein